MSKNQIFIEDEEENKIYNNIENILDYIKKDLGLIEKEVLLPSNQIIMIKVFYISYICNELINIFWENINKNGFKPKTICEFYFKVSETFNNAINGFDKIRIDMIQEKENLLAYSKLKAEGIGDHPTTLIFGNIAQNHY